MTALGLAVQSFLHKKSNKKTTPHKTRKSQTLTPKGLQNDVKMGVWGITFPNLSRIGETLILNDTAGFSLIIGVLGIQ